MRDGNGVDTKLVSERDNFKGMPVCASNTSVHYNNFHLKELPYFICAISDFERFLLREPDCDLVENSSNMFLNSPEIKRKILCNWYNVLLDSGSELSCTSQSLFKSKVSDEWKDFSVLPIRSISVKTANGHLTWKITKQICIPFNFNDEFFLLTV